MPTRVWIVAGPEWQTTAAALREVDSSLPRWIRDKISGERDVLVRKAKAAVMAVDVVGGPTRSTGMRARVAAGIHTRSGVGDHPYFRIYTSMPTPSEAPIPRGLDSRQGWRHPLFGDKRHWYTSRPTHEGWFTDTIAAGRDDIERALEDALERAARHIDAAG